MRILSTIAALLALSLSAFAAGPVGKWKVTASTPDGNTHNVDLVVKDEGGKLTATLNSERGSMPLKDVAANGDELTFKLALDMGDIPFKLKIDGDTLKGTITIPDGSTGTVTGKRDEAAASAAAAATPASAAGKWKIVAKVGEDREMNYTLDLKQDGSKLSGEIASDEGALPINDGKIDGAQISFKVGADDGAYSVTGTLNGKEMKGTYKAPNGSSGTYVATKVN